MHKVSLSCSVLCVFTGFIGAASDGEHLGLRSKSEVSVINNSLVWEHSIQHPALTSVQTQITHEPSLLCKGLLCEGTHRFFFFIFQTICVPKPKPFALLCSNACDHSPTPS